MTGENSRDASATGTLRGLLAAYALAGPAPTTETLDQGIARETGRLDAQSRGDGDVADDTSTADEADGE